MNPTPEPAETRPAPKRINYILAASLLAAGASLQETATQVGCTVGTLKIGLRRKGVTATAIRRNSVIAAGSGRIAAMNAAPRDASLKSIVRDQVHADAFMVEWRKCLATLCDTFCDTSAI